MEHDPRSSFLFLNRDKIRMYLDWLDLWQKDQKSMSYVATETVILWKKQKYTSERLKRSILYGQTAILKIFSPGRIAEAVHKIEFDTLAPRLRVSRGDSSRFTRSFFLLFSQTDEKKEESLIPVSILVRRRRINFTGALYWIANIWLNSTIMGESNINILHSSESSYLFH